jgi:hypothetical protein
VASNSSTHGVEAVIDDVFEVLAESDLPHELVLVTIHASELAHVSKCILQTISQLESIHVAQPILHVRVNNKLCKT